MAGALRKVSLNYNWTIKRAQNDLHHNIIKPQPRPTSPSFPNNKLTSGEFSVLLWDSNRLRLKFKSDYEELCEHLERVFFILFGWIVTLNNLRTIATRHFINHPIRSVVVLYEESGNLAHLGICPTSIWGLLVVLSRFVAPVAPFIVSWFREIFDAFLLIHVPQASTGEETNTPFVSQLVEYPIVTEEPERTPQVSNDSDVQAPVKDHTSSETSDTASTLSTMLVTDDTKGWNETITTVTHDDTRRFSLRKAPSHNDIESDNARKVHPGLIEGGSFYVYDNQPSPRSPDPAFDHAEAEAVRMGHHTDDVLAVGDYSILVHDSAVFGP